VTIVISLQTVGIGLVAAMLVTPAAAAYMLTRRLPVMMTYSILFGVLSGIIGLYLSYYLNIASGASIVLVATLIFSGGLLFITARPHAARASGPFQAINQRKGSYESNWPVSLSWLPQLVNPADVTLRALEVLRSVDCVICEEIREGSTLLKKLGVTPKELIALNEHNEQEQAADIVVRLFNKQDLALISDCGTPVFADPGHYLVQQATDVGIPVVPIPGPSSLMASPVPVGFQLDPLRFWRILAARSRAAQARADAPARPGHGSRADGYPLSPGSAAGRCEQEPSAKASKLCWPAT